MADWKQITARIRRARASKDPAGQLSTLFERTRDAMVAFELGKFFEHSGHKEEAAKWYSAAAERFRRTDWKSKAQEAVARLGCAIGEAPVEAPPQPQPSVEFQLTPPPAAAPEEKAVPFERNPEALESVVAVTSEVQNATDGGTAVPSKAGRRRRHRGRRGGRNRRRRPAASETAAPSEVRSQEAAVPQLDSEPPAIQRTEEPTPPRVTHPRAIPRLPVEPAGEPGPSPKGRYGDPGLASRISLLEMQFRRLLACSPAKLSEADRAPAGPGVFVLTDSDLTTYYFVEACQTLRVAIAHLLRGGSSRRGADSIKPRLAEHLGIPESRVAKYLADHCVVRWLQLDEGASHFAHFVIAVLRPVLNE